MDIITASVESQQVRAPVPAEHDEGGGGGPPLGRAMAVARREKARTEKEMALENFILNYL